jgi:hypothetical protein
MSNIRLVSGVRVVRGFAALAAAGMLTLFASTAAAHADESASAATATTTSASLTADTQTSTAESSTAASSTAASSSSAANNCPSSVQITLGSIVVNGSQVVVSFTHTGTECPDAKSSVLHVHENLLRVPHSGSDAVQLNRDYDVTPGFADSVTLPLLEAVDGKCFVQIDVHANGVNHGQFFPTATCPSESVSPSSSTSPSQVVNPPSPPAGSSSAPTKVVVPEESTPAALVNPPPALAQTGARAQNPLVIGASLLLAGSMLLLAGRPGRRWHSGLRLARTLWANGRH